MDTYFLYDNEGNYHGCTLHPENHPQLNSTTIEPPEHDDLELEYVKFENGTWVKYNG